MTQNLTLVVNGVERSAPASPERSLLAFLREELDLTGAKPGCGEGACGACTVLIDRAPVRACVTSLTQADGHSVTTIEGLAGDGALHPVQRAFLETGAMQCGYCIPGMILATASLLEGNPRPTNAQTIEALNGNLCRCCAYPAIRRAVERAVEVGVTAPRPTTKMSLPRVVSAVGPWDRLDPKQRDYFAALGEGLIVVLPPSGSEWWSGGGAWLHVGADGKVTAFTGKVDVGQDNRTTLSLLVAEELRVPLDAVTLIMGDTDVCPYDIGTFGSMSTAHAGSALRATAAAARKLLISRAASRWRVEPSTLNARDGLISTKAGGRSMTYAALVRGRRNLEVVGRKPLLTPASKWSVAGHPTVRLDALDVVTGAKRYPSDITRAGVLYGRVLRPRSQGARLESADLSAARAIDGVSVVSDDAFVGVAAVDAATADRALRSIAAEWTLEPQPSEAELETYLRSHPVEAMGWEGPVHEERGSIARGLGRSPVRMEATYTTAYIAHAPLETRAVLAEWIGERLTIWTGTQRPFGVREALAEALQIDESNVRVVVPLTGGGFGGKHTLDVAIQAARMARAAKRPVKVRWSREEEFKWAYLRPAAVIDVRSAATNDGRITAWAFKNTNAGAAALDTPYRIANVQLDFQPAASPLPQGSYRALAATANTFARESQMDELAHRLDQDPLDLRLAHLDDERLAAVLRAVANRVDWEHRARGSGSGIGIAGGVEKGGRVATAVEVRARPGGRLDIVRIVTAYECGAIVNPLNLRHQVEGATVMGLGAALFEGIHFAHGEILNAAFSKYRVPRFADVPPIEVVLIDRNEEPPAGAGETPIIAVAPAVANAIFEATGQRLRSLPLLPDGVLPALAPQ